MIHSNIKTLALLATLPEYHGVSRVRESAFFISMDKKELSSVIESARYCFNDRYGLQYIYPSTYNNILEALSNMRRCKYIDSYEYHYLKQIFKHIANNYWKIKRLDENQPRRIAQQFIGKKNIRNFIFNRDGYRCLCCGDSNSLQIDHIEAVNKGGANRIGNLQTLCRSCNSRKSDNYKDYR